MLTEHKKAETTLLSKGQDPVIAEGWGAARPAVEFHDLGPKNAVGHFSALCGQVPEP